MSDSQTAKSQAAFAAAALVEPGMIVGLGTGSTASLLIRRLGERVAKDGLRMTGVATSIASTDLARACAIPIRGLDEVEALDLCLDGADEIDSQFRMIKGRGGALLREKIIASAAKRRVTIITIEKRVAQLGTRMPLPVEVSTFGLKHTERRLRDLGAMTTIRCRSDGSTYLTDGGNAIIDCRFPGIENPDELDSRLQSVVGVFETGLFLNMCDVLVMGSPDRVEVVESHVRD